MCVLQSPTGTGVRPVPPASSRFWSDRQLDSEGLLFAVTRVIDRGIHHVIDSVHQTGHVLMHNTHRHHENILMHSLKGMNVSCIACLFTAGLFHTSAAHYHFCIQYINRLQHSYCMNKHAAHLCMKHCCFT